MTASHIAASVVARTTHRDRVRVAILRMPANCFTAGFFLSCDSLIGDDVAACCGNGGRKQQRKQHPFSFSQHGRLPEDDYAMGCPRALRSRFEDHVERRLGSASDVAEAAGNDDLAQFGLAGLRAECCANLLRQ